MSTTSEALPPAETAAASRPSVWPRFLGAFVFAVLTGLVVVGAFLAAFDTAFAGRVLPGVRVGDVDLSGLTPQQASVALASGFSGLREGRVVLHTAAGDVAVPYRQFSRQPDVDAMVDAAMAAGRSGAPLKRALAEVRIAIRGLDLAPIVAIDEAALATGVTGALAPLEVEPTNATIAVDSSGVVTTPALVGRGFDAAAATAAALDLVRRADAPSETTIETAAVEIPPGRSDAVVLTAKAIAERMIGDVTVTDGSKSWAIPSETVRGWLGFESFADGTLRPVVHEPAIPVALAAVAKGVERKAVSATFLVGKNGTTVGVTASQEGRSLDREGTAAAIAKAVAERANGTPPAPVPAVVVTVAPKLTTEEARKVAPLMVRLSSWKTWFPIAERNYYGANIWLPAQYINGTVLYPGQTFEWFRAVGPITRARGFGTGGVINGDHTDPTGAIGGGMCSSSTTLFNAALRAGLKMGSRANHSYYINRYPLGLDATVTIKGGSTTTMTFTNDMDHPIVIRGYKIRSGGKGWVRYEIWGIPDGRTVSIGKPVVTNVSKATTKTVSVTTLPRGVRKQTEYPSNGMNVSVTRVVRDGSGRVIHQETYRSHYRLWNGRIEVGV